MLVNQIKEKIERHKEQEFKNRMLFRPNETGKYADSQRNDCACIYCIPLK